MGVDAPFFRVSYQSRPVVALEQQLFNKKPRSASPPSIRPRGGLRSSANGSAARG